MGQLGGSAAQNWLYPILTHTAEEAGIAAGMPASATVVHKTGDMYGTENDAAYVANGSVRYVLVVSVTGPDEATGWTVVQRLSARVWQYEAGRPDYPAPIIAPPAPKLRDTRHSAAGTIDPWTSRGPRSQRSPRRSPFDRSLRNFRPVLAILDDCVRPCRFGSDPFDESVENGQVHRRRT